MRVVRFIYAILGLAFAIGISEVLIDFTQEMRGVTVKAYQRGPISHKLFTEQLTDQK